MTWLRNLCLGHRRRDLQDEIEAHLHMAIRDRIERGQSPADARRAALREFGNVPLVQDVTRANWGWSFLETVVQDTRFALRQIRKSPGFALTAVLTLALGIGANVAIFSLIYAALLRTLPIPHPEQLVRLQARFSEPAVIFGDGAYQRNGMYKALAGQKALAGLCGSFGGSITDLSAEEPVRVDTTLITGDCFSTLQVAPVMGRLLLPSDDTPTPGPQGFAAVLSYAWWNARYHRDPVILGRQLTVTDVFSRPMPLVIVGVLPPGFHGLTTGDDPRIYLPAYFAGRDNRDVNSNISMLLFGRMREGRTLARTEAELQPFFQAWLRDAKLRDVKDPAKARLTLLPDSTGYSGLDRQYGKGLRLLQALVALILLAVCFYLSTLFSARALARRREFAVRAALGASRARLMSGSILESALLVAAGTLAGIGIAWAADTYLLHFLSTTANPLVLDVRPQGWLLLFAAGVGLVALILTGFLPAWRATRTGIFPDMHNARAATLLGQRRSLGSVLLPLQIALSLVVVVVSSLLSASLLRALTQDNGFRLRGTVFISTDIPTVLPQNDKDGQQLRARLAFYDNLLDELNQTPGIQAASADVTHALGGALYGASASSPYRGAPPENSGTDFFQNWIAPRYFETAGTHVLAGREFLRTDRQGTPPVCILSASAARYFFPGISPIGRPLQTEDKRTLTVVGVVSDTRFSGLEAKPPMMLYFPIGQTEGFLRSVEFFLRTDDINASVAALRRLLHDRAGAHVMEVKPVSEEVASALSRTRLLATLANSFAALALLLSAIGMFGLLSYSVNQRVTEIGVRMALGASRARVIGMTLSQAALLVVPGLLLGLAGAWIATRFIVSLLYQTRPTDPVALAVSVLALLLASALASYLPARRAASINPVQALRAE